MSEKLSGNLNESVVEVSQSDFNLLSNNSIHDDSFSIQESTTVVTGKLDFEFNFELGSEACRAEGKISYTYEYRTEKQNGELKIEIDSLKIKNHQGNSVDVKVNDDGELYDSTDELVDKLKDIILNKGLFDKRIIDMITNE